MPDSPSASSRGAWSSSLGFILAASGSAIGLGNLVFFASNAYQYGGGAFYLPYIFALLVLGLPVLVVELALGTATRRSFPGALHAIAGRRGAFVGWWSQANAFVITTFYVTILAWGLGMLMGAFGSLFESGVTAPFAPFQTPSDAPNATAYFFRLVASGSPLVCVPIIWGLNVLILRRGTQSIERAVRVFVPLMWLFMIGLIVRGLTLDGGLDGVLYLFTPDWAGIASVAVWKGAFAQMFFTLSLGLGAMTAYASYLPKRTDTVGTASLVAFLNCGFEYVAGIAIFALLFAFALNPAGGTLTLSFFAIPQGIAAFPWGAKLFGAAFFLLLVTAGLTSSISLIESPVSALIDAFGISRSKALALVAVPGTLGSMAFALPQVIDPSLGGNGTLGLTLLDVMNHWAFNYSLLTCGLLTCLFVGWVLGADRLRAVINAHSAFRLGRWFDVLIRFVAPMLLGGVLIWSLVEELTAGALYGTAFPLGGHDWIPVVIPLVWIGGSLGVASYLTARQPRRRDDKPADQPPSTPPVRDVASVH
jgi:NSS family neurotransmitter:Na+ symporter